MSYQYPSGDEIQLAEDQIDDIMNEPVIRAVSEAYRLEAENQVRARSAVDTTDTSPDEQDWSGDTDQGTYSEGDDIPEIYSADDADEQEISASGLGGSGDFDDDEELPAPVITSQEKLAADTPPWSEKSNQMPESFDSKKGYNKEYRRNDYSYTDRDFTFKDPYDPVDPKDFDRMFVCRTNEYNPETGRQQLIEANPNDPQHLLEAMRMSAEITGSSRQEGLIKRFKDASSTTTISMTFAREAMGAVYRENGLDYETLSNPASSSASIAKGTLDLDGQHLYSFAFSKDNEGFHRMYRDNYLMQMNHRLTQEAIEKNREYFPNGIPLGKHDKEGFTFDKFLEISKQCAEDAFTRTNIQIDLIKQHNLAIEKSKAFSEQFKKEMAPKIKNESMIEGFGREFKVHKGETHADSAKRIRNEYKDHSKIFNDGLESRGIDVILAQGLAKKFGSDQVTSAHIRQAKDIWNDIRSNPIKYNSTESMISRVTGHNEELKNSLMHNLDGRSTFQRCYQTMQRYGEHLHCHADGRTRIRNEDRQAAKAFAASTLMTSQDEGIATRLRKTLEHNNYSPAHAISSRNRMLESVGRLKTNNGQTVVREDISADIRKSMLEKSTNQAVKGMAANPQSSPPPTTPPAPTGPDDQGPSPSGPSGPSRGKSKGKGM